MINYTASSSIYTSASHASRGECNTVLAPESLLFAPDRLLPRGGYHAAAYSIWRRSSYLRPCHLHRYRRYREVLAVSTYHWLSLLLLLAGNIEANTGPVRFLVLSFVKQIGIRPNGIRRSGNTPWTHASCCGIGPEAYHHLSHRGNPMTGFALHVLD